MQANSQDQVARLDPPSYQLGSSRALQGNSGLYYDHSKLNASESSFQSPIGGAPEVSYVRYKYLLPDLSRPQCRLLQVSTARWKTPYRCLSRQLTLKTRTIKLVLNSMGPKLTSYMDALFVQTHSAVCKSETGTSNRTFRIRFIAHFKVVPGRVVVSGTLENTGRKITQIPVEFPRRQMRYTTRRSL